MEGGTPMGTSTPQHQLVVDGSDSSGTFTLPRRMQRGTQRTSQRGMGMGLGLVHEPSPQPPFGPPNARAEAPPHITAEDRAMFSAMDSVCGQNPGMPDHDRSGEYIHLTGDHGREVAFWFQEHRPRNDCYDLSCGFKALNMALGSLTLPNHLFRKRRFNMPPIPLAEHMQGPARACGSGHGESARLSCRSAVRKFSAVGWVFKSASD
ncbi:unnamed protein product [Vitrella brassicaformis CCMP3155]|uniref:Uncharacterized protein n=1 Tax=Vitrella brassicaformis (strain CCMP3155) TaxID=1169540 RepID=A0A0G4GCF5_VITBC|nr:unnamed protein product [Vitrella brassicaformis CCMP3155]|eukprot:CEM26952.1 unnamed protein product [Vitrella brassicaformis CCMP3155]